MSYQAEEKQEKNEITCYRLHDQQLTEKVS